ncbi:MAG: hypothetical protein AB8F26_12865 [Phycisphaerales bacterium]
MPTRSIRNVLCHRLPLAALLSTSFLSAAAHAAPFTYQGRLVQNGQPANGSFDMTFQLTSSATGGFALAVDSVSNVQVVDGVFTAEIDFPSNLLNDGSRWMAINIEGTILSPRIRLRDTPRAQNAVRANAAGTLETPFSIVDSSTTVFEIVSTSSTGTAILGRHASTTGTTPGVRGSSTSNSSSATGIVGEITSSSPGGLSAGVRGINNSTTGSGIGVFGTQAGTGWGVYGNTPAGRGVYGFSFSGTGIYGASTSGVGMFATHLTSDTEVSLGTDDFAVDAFNTAIDGAGTAIRGTGGRVGVQGISTSPGFGEGLTRIGVQGFAGSFSTAADFIVGVSGSGQAPASGGGREAFGVRGTAQSGSSASTGIGIYGSAVGAGTNWAGFFQGDVHVLGTLSKSSGSFKIDHPLEPETKYLSHSFVESPDMMNIYNGVITLDNNGNASVELPHYFEALNRTFRYQLTAIGTPMPNLYISSEVSANSFAIAGGKPHARVSWEITGVRQDPSSLANPIIIEQDKPAHHHGKYLDPAAYGLDDSHAIHPKRSGVDH